jgi:hypothetical protein
MVVFNTSAMGGMMAGMMGGKNKQQMNPEMMAKGIIKGMLNKSKGIDAWSDVTYQDLGGGKIKVKATAYFKDVTKVKINGNSENIIIKKDGDDLIFTYDDSKKDEGQAPAAKAGMTDEQAQKQLQAMRMQMQQQMMMMGMMMKDLKITSIYYAPGKVADVQVFKKHPKKDAVKLVIDGAKILKAMNSMMANDEYMLAAIKTGKNPMQDKSSGKQLMKEMFGSDKVPSFRAKGPCKPLFDYDAEIKTAKENYAKIKAEYGLN